MLRIVHRVLSRVLSSVLILHSRTYIVPSGFMADVHARPEGPSYIFSGGGGPLPNGGHETGGKKTRTERSCPVPNKEMSCLIFQPNLAVPPPADSFRKHLVPHPPPN